MDDRIRKAFDQVHAEEGLKEKTAAFLLKERLQREKGKLQRKPRFSFGPASARMAATLASIILLIMAGGFSYNVYFLPSVYVDLDVNPSVSIGLNRFDRVVAASAYNDDGEAILQDVNLRHSSYDDAVRVLLETMLKQRYIDQDGREGLVSVTVQADGGDKEAILVASIENTVAETLETHHAGSEIEVYGVPAEIREEAYEHHLSPAKYLAITELRALDETVTFEDCAGHSIHEIRQITNQHREGHQGYSQTQVIDESAGNAGGNGSGGGTDGSGTGGTGNHNRGNNGNGSGQPAGSSDRKEITTKSGGIEWAMVGYPFI